MNIIAMQPAARSRQMRVFGALVVSYVVVATAYVQVPGGMGPLPSQPEQTMPMGWQGLAFLALVIISLYGAAGLAGWWLALRAGLPGVLPEGYSWSAWLRGPLVVGLAVGLGMVAVDGMARVALGWGGFPHPPFPGSLLASYSAAVGEEIIFRLFLVCLWFGLLRWLLGRIMPVAVAGAWAAGGAIALGTVLFALGHLGTALVLYNATTPVDLPLSVLVMLGVLNAPVGIAAGIYVLRVGLVGAVGIHLGANLVWHVLYGLFVG